MDKYSRRFHNMFPWIAEEEKCFEQDLLAEGRFVAEWKRRIREQIAHDNITQKMKELQDDTLESLLNIWYIYSFDKETWQEEYYMLEKDNKWNVIVDKEKKVVRFIDEKSGKIIEKKYID